jgi:NitT/TauT family transport system substrate-binding protein
MLTAVFTVPSQAADEIRFSVYQPAGLGCPQFELAQEKGYFAQEGIKFKPVYVQNGPQVAQLMAAGDLDVGCGGITVWLIAKSKGVGLAAIFSTAKGNAALLARPTITAIKDLNGKRCGTPGLGTNHDDNLKAFAKRNNIEIRHVYGVGMANVVAMYEKGEIDCMTGWEPQLAIASAKYGAKYLVDFLRPDSMESVEFAVTKEFAAKRGDVILRFVRAAYKATLFIEQRPDEAYTILARLLGIEKDIVTQSYKRTIVTKPHIDVAGAEVALADAIAGKKIQASAVGNAKEFIGGLVDHRYLESAIKSVKAEGWRP